MSESNVILTIETRNAPLAALNALIGKVAWWEIPDHGAWPGVQPRPPLYLEDGFKRPPMKLWELEDQKTWRLRPHP